jgi:hypothetical protein
MKSKSRFIEVLLRVKAQVIYSIAGGWCLPYGSCNVAERSNLSQSLALVGNRDSDYRSEIPIHQTPKQSDSILKCQVIYGYPELARLRAAFLARTALATAEEKPMFTATADLIPSTVTGPFPCSRWFDVSM